MAKRKAPSASFARSADPLYREIRSIFEAARACAYRAVNAAMVQSYWNVGRVIVEHEQGGTARAFYRMFEIRDAACLELEPEQFIRDPYVLEFLDLMDYPALRESAVEQAIIENLQAFLLELGKGFSFVARSTEKELQREIQRQRRLIDARTNREGEL